MFADTRYSPNNIKYWLPVIENLDRYNFGKQPETEPEYDEYIQAMLTAGEKYSGYHHNKSKWKDEPDRVKIACCTRRTGRKQIRKLPNGNVEMIPINCNLCDLCFKANSLKLKTKVKAIDEKMQESGNGQWRKKTVDTGTEAQSLKRRIKRNQDGRHIEVACTDDSNKNEIYVYVEDEPGKNMDEIYGEPVSLDDIDFDELYKANRETGKKLSTGKAFKTKPLPKREEDTIKIEIPSIITADVSQQDQAEEIIHRTNYLELADTPEQAKRLYQFQLKYIIKELEKAKIKILAINSVFYEYDKRKLLNDWNRNVKHWMSINASLPLKSEAKVDNITQHLYQKIGGEPEKLEN